MRNTVASLAIASLIALVTGCGDPTVAASGPRAFTLCNGDLIPGFATYRNDGAGWTPVPLVYSTGSYYFTPTPRVAFAYGYGSNFQTSVTLLLLTADELKSHRCQGWTYASSQGKTLVGAVTDFAGSSFATMALGPVIRSIDANAPNYTLRPLPQGPLDLVMMTTGAAEKVIVRRAVDLVDFSVMPNLDFNSGEAAAADHITLQAPSGSSSFFFRSKGGTSLPLNSSSSTALYPVLPASMVGDSDVFVASWSSSFTLPVVEQREIRKSFRLATNTTITSGAVLNDPVLTFTPTGTYYAIGAQLTSQPEYGNYIDIELREPGTSTSPSRYVHVIVSSGYLGATPGTWDVNISDLLLGAGFATTALPQTATAVSSIAWRVRASDGPVFWDLLSPTDGATIHRATKSPGWQ